MVMAAAACVAWIGGLEQWPQKIAALVTKLGLGKMGLLFLVNGIFLMAGMVMDLPMNLALLVPLLAPACVAKGDPPGPPRPDPLPEPDGRLDHPARGRIPRRRLDDLGRELLEPFSGHRPFHHR